MKFKKRIDSKYSGPEVIRECYKLALEINTFYFALWYGNVCALGDEHARFDALGVSHECNLPCGNDQLNSGAVCGGVKYDSLFKTHFSSHSVYQTETEPANSYAFPTNTYLGCYADLKASPAFHSVIPMRNVYYGPELLVICQRLAAKNNAVYFAIQNGIDCHFGPADTKFAAYGVSDDCYSMCGQDQTWNGINCGGSSSNSVYQISVLLSS